MYKIIKRTFRKDKNEKIIKTENIILSTMNEELWLQTRALLEMMEIRMGQDENGDGFIIKFED